MSSGRLSANSLSGLPRFVAGKCSALEILPPPDVQSLDLNMSVALCFSAYYCVTCQASASGCSGDANNLEHISGSICLRKAPSGAATEEPLAVRGWLVKRHLAIPVASASCRDLPKWLCFLAVVYLTTARVSVETSSKIYSVKGIRL